MVHEPHVLPVAACWPGSKQTQNQLKSSGEGRARLGGIQEGRGGLWSPITHIPLRAVNPFPAFPLLHLWVTTIIPIPQMRKKRPKECKDRTRAPQQ